MQKTGTITMGQSATGAGRCGRYNWQITNCTSIFKLIELNQWLLNKSWRTIAARSIELPAKNSEARRIYSRTKCYRGSKDCFEANVERIDWERTGTWYFYIQPQKSFSESHEYRSLDRNIMPLMHCDEFELYPMLPEQWHYIHQQMPDIVLIKQPGDSVLVSALDSFTIYEIISAQPADEDEDPDEDELDEDELDEDELDEENESSEDHF